jgi:predicted ATPase
VVATAAENRLNFRRHNSHPSFTAASDCRTIAIYDGADAPRRHRWRSLANSTERRSIGEAIDTIETTKETWFEAEANRIAGKIALQSPKPDATKAQDYFERALAVSHKQQAKSWELRASMSLARLWRDQGKVDGSINELFSA